MALVAVPAITLLTPTVAHAQDYTNGTLAGSIQGTNGQPIAGANVTVRSAAQGVTRNATTDANGNFRVPLIPTGRYDVTVNASGFDSLSDQVVVSLGDSSAYTFTLASQGGAAADATNLGDVVVTGVRQNLDFARTTTGLTVDLEELVDQLPVTRSITAVTLLAPTVTTGGSAANGAFAGQPSIGGGSVGENAFYINGLNTTNFDTYIGSVTVPFDFYKTVEVKTGGYPAEFGRATGGVVNAVTKSGTNDFTVGLHVNWSPSSLEETSPDTFASANRLTETNATDWTVEAGGPIIRDRLFFYGLYQGRDVEVRSASNSGRSYSVDTSTNPFYGAKVDAYITDSQRLEFTYFDTTRETKRLTYTFDPFTDAIGTAGNLTTFQQGGQNYVGRYTGSITDWLTVSAAYGVNKDSNNTLPGDPSLSLVQDTRSGTTVRLSTTQPTGSNQIINTRREFYRADADIYANIFGQHHFRLGFDVEKLEEDKVSSRNGGYNYIYRRAGAGNRQGVPIGQDYVQITVGTFGGKIQGKNSAYYLQDSWDVTQDLNIQLGVRSDSFVAENLAGEPSIKLDNNIAFRGGFSWDPNGDRRDKVFGSYGRYFIPPALNLGFRSGDRFFNEFYNAPAGGFVVDPVTGLPAALGTQLVGFPGSSACPTGGRSAPGANGCDVFGNGTVEPAISKADLNLQPTSEDEFILGYQRQLNDQWTGSVSITHRTLNTTSEDIAVDSYINALCAREGRVGCDAIYFGDYQYIIANPGRDLTFHVRDPLPGGGPGGAAGRIVTIPANETGLPKPVREYTGLTFQFEHAFDGVWALQGSYTISKSIGNYEGTVLSDNGQTDAGSTILYDHTGLSDNQYGLLPNHHAHQLKLFGSYQVMENLLIGANLRVQSGKPYGCIGVHPTDPDAAGYGVSSRFCQGRPVPRGSSFYSDWSTYLDMSARYTVPIGLPGDLVLRADVFNVFNLQAATERYENGDLSSGAVDPNYGRPVGYQQPRFVRVGLDWQF